MKALCSEQQAWFCQERLVQSRRKMPGFHEKGGMSLRNSLENSGVYPKETGSLLPSKSEFTYCKPKALLTAISERAYCNLIACLLQSPKPLPMFDFLHNYPLFANTYLGFLKSPLFKGVLAFKHLPQHLPEHLPHHLPQDLPDKHAFRN